MTTGSESIKNNTQQVDALIAADSFQDKLDSNKRIAETLLNESDKYSSDSKKKEAEAKELLQAADVLEKLAKAVRLKAEQLRNEKINKEKALEEVTKLVKVLGSDLKILIPPDAKPEELDRLVEIIKDKAKENREKARELFSEAKELAQKSNNLRQQASDFLKKEMNFSDLTIKSALAHNEGLRMVFVKLGINDLDYKYKEQVAYAERKAHQDS